MARIADVVVLSGNFAGLGAAQAIRRHAGDAVRITIIDRKTSHGRVPTWGVDAAQMIAATVSL